MTLFNSEYCHEDPWGEDLDGTERSDPDAWEDLMTRREQ